MEQNDEDSVDAGIGDNGKDIAVGKDITQSHQEATGNVVNIFHRPALPVPRHRRPSLPRGELMADAANEIWKVIAEMNAGLGRVENALDTNTRATEKHAEAIQDLSKISTDNVAALSRIAQALRGMGIQIPDPNVQFPTISRLPWWYPLLTPILLMLIFFVLFWYFGLGGHLP